MLTAVAVNFILSVCLFCLSQGGGSLILIYLIPYLLKKEFINISQKSIVKATALTNLNVQNQIRIPQTGTAPLIGAFVQNAVTRRFKLRRQ